MSPDIYERIHRGLEAVLGDLKTLPSHCTMKAGGFMDLHLDKLQSTTESTVIALSHYYRHPSGDMIPDPDMEIRIFTWSERAEALAYQDSFGYRAVYPEPGKVDVRAKKDLNRFLLQWLRNLREQGFRRESEASHVSNG